MITNTIFDRGFSLGDYSDLKTNALEKTINFAITDRNSTFNELDQTWTCEWPIAFVENDSRCRQVEITNFIFFRPDGSSDIGTTFHSPELLDGDYSQLDFFIGLSGTSINGTYTLNSRKSTITYYFKDYTDLEKRCSNTETVQNSDGTTSRKPVHFFIQCKLYY